MKVIVPKIRRWDTSDGFETLNSYYPAALEPISSPRAKKAFPTAAEPDALGHAYARNAMGQGSLLGLRLVEADVRFVSVVKGDHACDHHGKTFPSFTNDFIPELDRALSPLGSDVEQRGSAG
jgi:hypothetical protein